MPDDLLFAAADAGKLRDSDELRHQTSRMLADPRADALVDNFAGQWLVLRNIRDVSPDPDQFPDFDENLRDAFLQETELFFESQLHDDRSVVELLSANYTYMNERLARHYGIPNVYGSRFRRVTVTDEARKGLLGKGSILAVTLERGVGSRAVSVLERATSRGAVARASIIETWAPRLLGLG